MGAPATLDELCGQTEPFRVLATDPRRRLGIVWGSTYGDRLVFTLGFEGRSGLEFETWSTGPCGEDPIHLTPGLHAGYGSPHPRGYHDR